MQHQEWTSLIVNHAATAQPLQLYPTLCDPMDYSLARLLCPWDSPGKNTGVGCHALLQGILPTQGSNLTLAGSFFTTSATWEAQKKGYRYLKWRENAFREKKEAKIKGLEDIKRKYRGKFYWEQV